MHLTLLGCHYCIYYVILDNSEDSQGSHSEQFLTDEKINFML